MTMDALPTQADAAACLRASPRFKDFHYAQGLGENTLPLGIPFSTVPLAMQLNQWLDQTGAWMLYASSPSLQRVHVPTVSGQVADVLVWTVSVCYTQPAGHIRMPAPPSTADNAPPAHIPSPDEIRNGAPTPTTTEVSNGESQPQSDKPSQPSSAVARFLQAKLTSRGAAFRRPE